MGHHWCSAHRRREGWLHLPVHLLQEVREKAWGRRVDLGVLCLALLVAGCSSLMLLDKEFKVVNHHRVVQLIRWQSGFLWRCSCRSTSS